MGSERKCRGCNAPLVGAAHLMLPRAITGGRGLCLTRADRSMEKYHTHSLHEFVPRYLDEIKEQTPIKSLQARVAQLEALLEEVTRPNP